jgi:diguanylate cyclase (GGDEF)-like protein
VSDGAIKILIADDDPITRLILQTALTKWGYQVLAACDGDEAWKILEQPGSPQLAILDWMMPGLDGVQLCLALRKREVEPYVYVLLLTAKSDKKEIAQGLEAGADDYLTKPFDQSELKARLRTGQRIVTLQSELITARESFRLQATHDQLTGLLNRRAILEALEREFSRAQREETPLALIMADLDYFKDINDSYGHAVGDQVLREAAHRMQSAIRPYDAIGRCGGEEFLFILPRCTSCDALTLAERIQTVLGQTPVQTEDGQLVHVTMSVGVTVTPTDTAPAKLDSLLALADAALYRAKRGGRNRTELAAPDMAGDACAVRLPESRTVVPGLRRTQPEQ